MRNIHRLRAMVEVSFLESCHVLAIRQAWDRFHLLRHDPLPISFRNFSLAARCSASNRLRLAARRTLAEGQAPGLVSVWGDATAGAIYGLYNPEAMARVMDEVCSSVSEEMTSRFTSACETETTLKLPECNAVRRSVIRFGS
jgi:hypothetical protein